MSPHSSSYSSSVPRIHRTLSGTQRSRYFSTNSSMSLFTAGGWSSATWGAGGWVRGVRRSYLLSQMRHERHAARSVLLHELSMTDERLGTQRDSARQAYLQPRLQRVQLLGELLRQARAERLVELADAVHLLLPVVRAYREEVRQRLWKSACVRWCARPRVWATRRRRGSGRVSVNGFAPCMWQVCD